MAVRLLGVTTAYIGLAADTKPTAGVTAGSTFYEQDTGKRFIYTGSAWVQFSPDVYTDRIVGLGTGVSGFVLKDIKNLPDGAFSGTPKVVEVNIGGTAYYLKVYPVLI